MQTLRAYSDAKAAAERIVRELAKGSQAAALTANSCKSGWPSNSFRDACPSAENNREFQIFKTCKETKGYVMEIDTNAPPPPKSIPPNQGRW